MAGYSDHLHQARKNFTVLQQINQNLADSWDWQVTTAFYTGLHLINAHLAKKANLHYRTHDKVKTAINPHIQLSPTKVDVDTEVAYNRLQMLSRRARYLVNEKDPSVEPEKACFTSDKHFAKAIRDLQTIISFFEKEYKEELGVINIKCDRLSNESLTNITITSKAKVL